MKVSLTVYIFLNFLPEGIFGQLSFNAIHKCTHLARVINEFIESKIGDFVGLRLCKSPELIRDKKFVKYMILLRPTRFFSIINL